MTPLTPTAPAPSQRLVSSVVELWCVLVRGALLPHTADSPEHAWSDTLREPVWLQACLREVTATYGSLQTLGVAADALDEVNQLVFDLRLVMCQREVPGGGGEEGREVVVLVFMLFVACG